MSFNGSGTFVINSTGQPVVANTVISSTVLNALTADLATGLSTCITKDGQTTPTANIPMGTFKFTGLGNGSAATDSATLGQVQASTTKLVTVSGTDTITGTMTPALTAYATGQMFYFVAGATNTGAVTLNIDGLGAKSVTRHGSVALVSGDILSGEVCVVVYDGTRFQLLNPASYTNLGVTGNLTLSGGTANGVAYLNASKVVTSGSALVFDGTNLGIGTASPASRLHVQGNQFRQNDATNTFGYTINTTSSTTTLATLFGGSSFAIQTGNSGTNQLFLDTSGNLGIGTASPGNRLTVNDPGTGIGLANAASGNFNIGLLAGTGSALAYVYQRANSDLLFGTNDTERMRLDSSGNLGIGTASPSYRLDVQAPVLDMRGLSTTGTNYVRQRMTNTGGDFYYGIDGSAGANFGVIYGAVLWYTGAYPMVFATNNAERMRITSAGNIVAGASAALATTATDGFLYVPTCAGTPTGTPTAITGMAPVVVDTTNNKLYFYSGGAWRDAGP